MNDIKVTIRETEEPEINQIQQERPKANKIAFQSDEWRKMEYFEIQ